MHIFKNMATMIWDHLPDGHPRLIGYSDGFEVLREDVQCMASGPQKWTSDIPRGWTLTRLEMRDVKEMIAMVRTPTGYM
jgi:hypothetical protein